MGSHHSAHCRTQFLILNSILSRIPGALPVVLTGPWLTLPPEISGVRETGKWVASLDKSSLTSDHSLQGSLGDDYAGCTMSWTSFHSSSGTLSIYLNMYPNNIYIYLLNLKLIGIKYQQGCFCKRNHLWAPTIHPLLRWLPSKNCVPFTEIS